MATQQADLKGTARNNAAHGAKCSPNGSSLIKRRDTTGMLYQVSTRVLQEFITMNETLVRQPVTDCDRAAVTPSRALGANGRVHHRPQPPPPHHPPRRSLWWASDNLSLQPPPAPMEAEHESPPLRSTILGSFLRGRPRGTSQSVAIPADGDHDSHSPSSANRRRPAAAVAATNATAAATAGATPQSVPTLSTGISGMLRRRRSAGTLQTTTQPMAPQIVARLPTAPAPSASGPTHRIRLVPSITSTRSSLRFDPITRDLRDGDMALRIGRFTDRSGMGLAAANASNSNKLAFKSKVVSRAHAEIWVEDGGKFYIRDTKSSSGTFLNHVRLSPAGAESARHQLRDGDILQLGVDYQGGTEDIYKAVKIRVEIGREWQSSANAFNTNAIRQLKQLAVTDNEGPTPLKAPSKSAGPKTTIPDCCICLFGVTIRQALFIAPCSHTFHYKCIRPLLTTHHPSFSCPLCRTFFDLDEDVEVDNEASIGEEDALALSEEEGGRQTEVELDTGASRLASAMNHNRRTLMQPVIDLTEPDEEDAHGHNHTHTGLDGALEEEVDAEMDEELLLNGDDHHHRHHHHGRHSQLIASEENPPRRSSSTSPDLDGAGGSGSAAIRVNGGGVPIDSEGEGSGAGHDVELGVGADGMLGTTKRKR